jgi:hypothetical protein
MQSLHWLLYSEEEGATVVQNIVNIQVRVSFVAPNEEFRND